MWLARLKRGLRQKEGAELRVWLERRSHRAAIATAAAEWHGPEVIAVLAQIFPIPQAILEPRRKGRPALSTAAAIAGACVTVGLPIAILVEAKVNRYEYTTTAEATRRLTLEDGTGAELNRGTQINVVFAARARSVLVARGEALFKVTSEPNRPFYIHAAGRNFETTVATFDVRYTAPDTLTLTVLEGTVTAFPRPRPGKNLPPILIEPLRMLVMEPDQEFGRALTQQDVRTQLAWHKGI